MAQKHQLQNPIPKLIRDANLIPFYTKKNTERSYTHILMYDNDSQTLSDRGDYTIDEDKNINIPVNDKLFEYVLMMHYLDKINKINGVDYEIEYNNCDYVKNKSNSLLPCFGTPIYNTGYTDQNALLDMDFKKLRRKEEEEYFTIEDDNYINCLGLDIKLKGVIDYNQDSSLPDLEYADSIRGIHKLYKILEDGDDAFFYQIFGLFNNSNDTAIVEKIISLKMGKNEAERCVPRDNDQKFNVYLQLLTNKIYYFNVNKLIRQGSRQQTLAFIQNKLQNPRNDRGLKILNTYFSNLSDDIDIDRYERELNNLVELIHNFTEDDFYFLLERGVNRLNLLLGNNSLIRCRRNGRQRNPQLVFLTNKYEGEGKEDIRLEHVNNIIFLKKRKTKTKTIIQRKQRSLYGSFKNLIGNIIRTQEKFKSVVRVKRLNSNIKAFKWFVGTYIALAEEGTTEFDMNFNLTFGEKFIRLIKRKIRENPSIDRWVDNFEEALHKTMVYWSLKEEKRIERKQEEKKSDQGQGGGNRNNEKINFILYLKLYLLSLSSYIYDIVGIDLENFNLTDYGNHPIWKCIELFYNTILSTSDNNFQIFLIPYEYYQDIEIVNLVLEPFENIVQEYNKIIRVIRNVKDLSDDDNLLKVVNDFYNIYSPEPSLSSSAASKVSPPRASQRQDGYQTPGSTPGSTPETNQQLFLRAERQIVILSSIKGAKGRELRLSQIKSLRDIQDELKKRPSSSPVERELQEAFNEVIRERTPPGGGRRRKRTRKKRRKKKKSRRRRRK